VRKANTDSAKSLSWMIDFQFCRLAITQEMTTDGKEAEKIDGNMIKKFCSGGDELQARKNHQDEYNFKLQSSLLVCCNDCPEIKPTDAMEFCNNFQMKSKFVDKVDKMDENLKLKTFKYYEKDPLIKSEILNDPLIISEFVNMIFEAYNTERVYPQEILEENEENEDDDDMTKLFNIFTFTDNLTGSGKDFISNDDLKDIIRENKIPFHIKKCKMLLKTKGAIESRLCDGSRGISGIKIKERQQQEDEEDDNTISKKII
jgi:hypothetical protein